MVKILVDYKTYRESKTSLKFWLKYVLSLWRRGQVTLNWADLWTRPQNPRSCISQQVWHDKDTRICLISLRKVHKRYVKYFWWCQSALKNNRYPPPPKKNEISKPRDLSETTVMVTSSSECNILVRNVIQYTWHTLYSDPKPSILFYLFNIETYLFSPFFFTFHSPHSQKQCSKLVQH